MRKIEKEIIPALKFLCHYYLCLYNFIQILWFTMYKNIIFKEQLLNLWNSTSPKLLEEESRKFLTDQF